MVGRTGGVLLGAVLFAACASSQPAPPAHIYSETLPEDPPTCGSGTLQITVTAPSKTPVELRCPTLGLPAQTVAAGDTWTRTTVVAEPGLHICVPYDPEGTNYTEGVVPVAVLAGEHHTLNFLPEDGTLIASHGVRRCDETGTHSIVPIEAVDFYASSWFLSADGTRAARFDQYIKSGGVSLYLATASPSGFTRHLITESEAPRPTFDEAALAAVSDELRAQGYRRMTRGETLPVFGFRVEGDTVVARSDGKSGTAKLPAYPVEWVNPGCCPLEAGWAFRFAGSDIVFGTLAVHCKDTDACDDMTYGSPDTYQQIAIPLIVNTPASFAVSKADASALLQSELTADDAVIDSDAWVGSMGPDREVLIAVVVAGSESRLGGWLVVNTAKGQVRVPFPTLSSHSVHNVADLWLQDTDGDGQNEAILMVEEMTGIGPTGAQPFVSTYVLGWDGEQLSHRTELTKRLEGAKDKAAVTAVLAL